MQISIILPCRNEARHMARCLDSILATDYPADRLELLVVDGMSTDGTRAVLTEYASRHREVSIIDNPDGIVPVALNLGIRRATGDVIIRMDAHVVYPPDYIPRLVRALTETGADNVGGCIVTLPADRGRIARAIAIALSHPFGVGNSYFRIGAGDRRWVDTVPFGCFRREVFTRIGMFDEELVRNQDDEFNHRLIRNGGRVLLAPEIVSYYRARGSFAQLARMYYQYGYYKPLATRKIGRVMTVRQLVPPGFVLAMVQLGLLALVWPAAATTFTAIATSYAIAVGGCTIAASRGHGARCAIALATAFLILHWSYGIGFLRGTWDAVIRPRRPRLDPRAVPMSR